MKKSFPRTLSTLLLILAAAAGSAVGAKAVLALALVTLGALLLRPSFAGFGLHTLLRMIQRRHFAPVWGPVPVLAPVRERAMELQIVPPPSRTGGGWG